VIRDCAVLREFRQRIVFRLHEYCIVRKEPMTCDPVGRRKLADAKEAVKKISRFEAATTSWRGFGLNLPYYPWHETRKQTEDIERLISTLLQRSGQA
jgi:hypothetical protein